MYDVIIIGAGPSGLMASIAAAENGSKVLLLEKGKKPGNKLAISGGGRCNVTNRLPQEEIIKNIPGNGRFLYGPFSVFNNEDIIHFFENLGVPLKEEDHGRMFPVSNKAKDVVNALLDEMKRLDVDLKLETKVAKLLMDDEKILGVRLDNGEEIRAHAVVLAVGGKAVPQTGSTGDGYPWAERAGHTITTIYPTEVPLLSSEPFIVSKELQGLALRDAAVSVLNAKGKTLVTHTMDMLFTHFGLSGPAILRCSQFVVKERMKNGNKPVTMKIDTLPLQNEEEIFQQINKIVKEDAKKQVNNSLKGIAPEKWLHFLLERATIDPTEIGAALSSEKLRALARLLKSFTLEVNGTQPIERAFVTGGGVSTKEIVPKTMASKKKDGLYFCGEILDIHGYTGGYNITSALVTGRIAGMNAGQYAALL
ncbi:NAD(P)/FAD-dependent oxidoreductase [Sporosarcina pasteurii]|uniref:Tricarballylate dehydrogenase n=1 Tax=Sporosarcina pasteurii TaxID=1474 RepID=A0A380C696_SPOPA|nr:NAD(P)/FAD-dependent oxidoreductase [Sporosarcina pasteurii]MDS9471791.1 NAD(P)/FAD-dependent oxidoreductase [Sporosarcina pasteurii]QBQ04615.1 NAD(P)/FAD-dependent oxidoreductase [Sporosarcina pasteurii]SUJ13769.1 tricarballylate dehydrogenase [Sporosarcina pasteurii]